MNRRPWSPRELGRLRRLYGKHLALEVAQRLNRRLPSVYTEASRLGLTKKRHGFRRADEALDLRVKGLTYREIAGRMGVKEGTVSCYLYFARHPEQYVKLLKAVRRNRKS